MSELLQRREVWSGPDYYAHTPGETGAWHTWADHARGVSSLAAEFGEALGVPQLTGLLGLTHDLGKLAREVQEAFLERARESAAHPDDRRRKRLGVAHKGEGAAAGWLLAERGEPLAAKLMACANYGHHHQIPHINADPESVLVDMQSDPRRLDTLLEVADRLTGLDARETAARVSLPAFIGRNVKKADRLSRIELLTRMCHSALVDADFLDTAAHFHGLRGPRRHRVVGMERLGEVFFDSYDARYGTVPSSDLNDLRSSLFRRCVEAGDDPDLASSKRIYRLPAQTGSGKTMAAAAFALSHAAAFRKRRVIVAVPYTSITTQNAEQYRDAFAELGDDVVLEHHSNIVDDALADSMWRRLSAQNWDAEFIVTTTVQLFESLFSNRPTSTRKLHRLAGSVLVIDEVQALPLDLVPSILRMLRDLVECFDVTVLLASATQPSYWSLDIWHDGDFDPIDIADVAEVPDVTRRVSYEVRQAEQTWMEVVDELADLPQVLTIVNTTIDAQVLHQKLAEVSPVPVLHLSTRMCGQHRLDVLNEVRSRLAAGEPIQLISTQLIEAGVDVDFPVVYRAMGPADSIVQSAGRCNREGRLGLAAGRVVVFRPAEGSWPSGRYRDMARLTARIFIEQAELHSFDRPSSLAHYYNELLAMIHGGLTQTRAVEVDEARRACNFPEVARLFTMIEADPLSVLVTDYGSREDRAAVDDLLTRLWQPDYVATPGDHRLITRFSARLPQAMLGKEPVDTVDGVHIWNGEYDPRSGLVLGAAGLLM